MIFFFLLFLLCTTFKGFKRKVTWAWRLLTLLSLPTLSSTALASKLGHGGVTQADTGDDTSTTGDRAR